MDTLAVERMSTTAFGWIQGSEEVSVIRLLVTVCEQLSEGCTWNGGDGGGGGGGEGEESEIADVKV